MEPKNPEFSQMANPEVAEVELTPEQEEQAKYWLERIEREMAADRLNEKSPEEAEKEKWRSELKEIFDAWLVPEKLDSLHELKNQAEAMASPLRAEAKKALVEITKRMPALGDSDDLKDKYRVLSMAVGIINNGLVDHTRQP
ncbi:hypothetical protein HY633_03685 [Candidatus Uhrbacteria bacterium]|nr:hypothetical protein [Candidatus Uhrbacteria bacterium]